MQYNQPIDNQKPLYHPPAQPTQPQAYAQAPLPQAAAAPQAVGYSFTADVKVMEIMQMVHPELSSAMINIAIKKFAEDGDFVNYFIRDEYKAQAEATMPPQDNTPKPTDVNPVATGVDFSGGW